MDQIDHTTSSDRLERKIPPTSTRDHVLFWVAIAVLLLGMGLAGN